ncbi:MAG: hypothetical protein ACK5LR_07660 [Mangrovibacterium sp.]
MFSLLFSGMWANAQTITNAVTIEMDFCTVHTNVIMNLSGLPSTATTSTIKWYEIDNTGAETIVATGVTTYTSLFTRKYYITYVDSADGVTYKTNNFTTGTELVTNGNFEEGNTGFTTKYTYVVDGSGQSELYPEGYYAVGSNANNYHGSFYGLARGGTGNFMIVNGSPNGELATIWTQEIAVKKGTTYYFSAYGISLNQSSPYANLRFSINGAQIGTNQLLSKASVQSTKNAWTVDNRFYGNWTADSDVAVLSIVNLQTAAGGNDFGIDDISFGTFSPPAVNIGGLNGNVEVCEGTPISITANVSDGCADEYAYEWINYTDTSTPVLYSNTSALNIDYPTQFQHGGEWKLVTKDSYTTDTLSFYLNLLETPDISFTTSCVTRNQITGVENSDGAIYITGDGSVAFRLLNSSGAVVGAWSSSTFQYENLASGTYTIEAKFADSSLSCTSSAEVSLSSEMFTVLPPDQFCQGGETNITVSPSLCCYEWSDKTQKFPDKCTESDQTYVMSSTLFKNTYVEGSNQYVAGTEVSYRQVGIFRLEEVNNALIVKDDGKTGFTYSIYEYPFNPKEPSKNFVVRINYSSSLSKAERAIKKLTVGKVYVIVANASSTASECYGGLMYTDAGKMTSALFPDISWYNDPEGTDLVGEGESITTETLFPSGTATPGIYSFYVSCCTDGCNIDKVSVTINPIPVLSSNQTVCSGSSTNIKPIVLDANGNEIDTELFPIEYKWSVLSNWGVVSSGITASDYYQETMTQTISLADGFACGEATYSVTARVGGSTAGCESNTTNVTVRIVDLNKIEAFEAISQCVLPITSATWNALEEPDSDIAEERPDYIQFKEGDTSLDFSTDAIPSDACYTELMNNFEWWITKDSAPTTILYSGITQPSADLVDGNVIQLGLDDAAKSEAFTVHYQLNVRCGNGLFSITRPIEVKPRPTMTKTE